MESRMRVLIVMLVAVSLIACDKKKDEEDAGGDPDAVDMTTDVPDDTETPDAVQDTVEDAVPDSEEDVVGDVEPDSELPVGAPILFTVTPGAQGLGGSAVNDHATPESAIFDSSTYQPTHVPGTNGLWVDAASLGLASADDIDGISIVSGPPPYRPTFWFSVEDYPSHTEGNWGTDVEYESLNEDDPGDVFSSEADGLNWLEYDEVSLGLEPATAGGTPKDDLNGLELSPPPTASGIVYFTVKPTAAGLGSTAVATTPDVDLPGTIFMSGLDGNNEVAFTRIELGLAENDDVDGLQAFGVAGTAQYVHFSVTIGSTGATGTSVAAEADTDMAGNGAAGDVFGSGGWGRNELVADSRDLGLNWAWSGQDELDALAVKGDFGDVTVPLTPTPIPAGEGLHSVTALRLPFNGWDFEATFAVAHFVNGAVYYLYPDWTIAETWDLPGDAQPFDLAVSPSGQYLGVCTTMGSYMSDCFGEVCTHESYFYQPCLQIVPARGNFYFTQQGGSNSFAWGDQRNITAPGSISLGGETPWGLVVYGTYAYVVTDPGTGAGHLRRVDISGYPSAGYSAETGQGPRFVAISSDGTMLIVTNSVDDTATVHDPADGATLRTVSTGVQPFGVAALGHVALVANYTGDTLQVIDMTAGTVLDTIDVTGCNPGFVKMIPGLTHAAAACYTSGELVLVDLSAYL